MKKAFFLILSLVCSKGYATWDKGIIHIFGDSHSAYSFTNTYKDSAPPAHIDEERPLIYEKSLFEYCYNNEIVVIPFYIHWISRTMHMIGEKKLEIVDFKKHLVQEGDIVLLHFGGIDSYHGHLEKQYMKGRDLEEIVDTLAKNFIAAIAENKKLYDQLTVIIMGVIPPCILSHNKSAFEKEVRDIVYEKFIVMANQKLNNSLAYHAKLNKFLYFDVTHLFQDGQGVLRYDLADGHHVKPCFNYLIKEHLMKLILENESF